MYFKSLDEEIALYLYRTGKTQAQLAEEVGMASNTFSRKRRGAYGKEFSIDEVRKVAEVIGLTSFDGIMADYEAALIGVA